MTTAALDPKQEDQTMAAGEANVEEIDDAMEGIGDDDDADEEVSTAQVGEARSLTDDNGVVKTIQEMGSGWEQPEKGDKVTVHYTGRLLDGTVFDSSVDRGTPFEFTVGTGQVIKGWDTCVPTMKKGEKCLIRCEPDYAYGATGSPPKIPPNSTLEFEVKLLSWQSVKDVKGDGGVIKTIIDEGSYGGKPSFRDFVVVAYKVRTTDGQEVAASSDEGTTLPMSSAEGWEVPGLWEAARTMQPKEKVHLKLAPQYAYGDAGKSPKVPAGASVEAEISLLVVQKVEDVTDDGHVVMRTLVPSTEYVTPRVGAQVTLRYKLCLEDGAVVEERGEGNEVTFVADMGEILYGLEMAVLKMKKGAKAEVRIQADYGYGQEGRKDGGTIVPPNASLVAEMELVDFVKGKESWEMSKEEKVERANQRKGLGNSAYKAAQLGKALRYYKQAEDLLSEDKDASVEVKAQIRDVRRATLLNIAAVYLKQKDYAQVVQNCSKVLDQDSGNVKALYRRAQAYIATSDYVEAELDLQRARAEDGDNKDVITLMQRLKQARKETEAKQAKLYGNMFKHVAPLSELEARKTAEKSKMEADGKQEQGADAMEVDGSAGGDGNAEAMETEVGA